MGRENKYDTHLKPRLETIKAWRRKGMSEKEIQKLLCVGHQTFNKYKKIFPEFKDALMAGLEDAVSAVENAHFKAAIGYEYEEKKIFYDLDENGKPRSKPNRIEITKKMVQPNVTAQIHFLKNRASKDWHDRSELELTGKDGGDLTINITHDKNED